MYEGWIHRKADHNFFISKEDEEFAREKFGVRPGKSTVITYGVLPFDQPSNKKEIRKKLGNGKMEIISISVDENLDSWKKAVKDDNMIWLQLREIEKIGVVTRLNINAYPTYMVINKNREIVFEANNPFQLKDFLSKQFDVKF